VLALDAGHDIFLESSLSIALVTINVMLVHVLFRISDVHPPASRTPLASFRRVDVRSIDDCFQVTEFRNRNLHRYLAVRHINGHDPAILASNHGCFEIHDHFMLSGVFELSCFKEFDFFFHRSLPS
jgi:hypothetical protein